MTTDELIGRLRARAADPARRTDVQQTEFGLASASLGLADLFDMSASLAGDLGRVVEANEAGRSIDPDVLDRSEHLESGMTMAVPTVLPNAAEEAALERVEAAIGARLPTVLKRVYTEVADGGFGPGAGLLALEAVAITYQQLRADPPGPTGLEWPAQMVPLVDLDPGFYCLRMPAGEIIDWDPEGISENESPGAWARSFRAIAPDLERWLAAWVGSPTPAEARELEMTRLRRDGLRQHLETIAAMTPAEREAIGLPAEGWETAFIDEEDL